MRSSQDHLEVEKDSNSRLKDIHTQERKGESKNEEKRRVECRVQRFTHSNETLSGNVGDTERSVQCKSVRQ